jgi:polyisoprenoid-binding protein YceI
MTNLWNIDAAHSAISFSIRHMAFAKVRGRFTQYSGTIQLDDADLARSSVEVSIDAASIDTGTPQRDQHLRSADFFDVAKFPALRFRSTRVEALGGDRLRVIGELTIRDVTREVALEAETGGRAKDPWAISASASRRRPRSTARTTAWPGTSCSRPAACSSVIASRSSSTCKP